MKIAFISDALYMGHKGGIEYVEKIESEELAKDKRYEVHFISMRWPGMEKNFVKGNIHYHTLTRTRIDRFYRHGRRSMRTSIMFSLSMLKLFFWKQRFDVIEANMFPILHIPILKLYCKLTRTKLILDVVEVWERSYWSEYLKNGLLGNLAYRYAAYFLGSAQAYLANSSATAERLRKEGINKERINVFAPTLENGELESIRKSVKRKPQIIFSGRFIKEKRLDKWLHVVKEVTRKVPKARALLIGDGPEKNALRRMVKELRLEKRVRMEPWVPEERDFLRQLAESSVLLLTSEREGLSTTALKSVAMDVPVVIPESSPVPKEVRELCVVAKESMLAEKVIEIIRSGEPKKYLVGKEGLRVFSSSNVVPFYDSLFLRMFNGRIP